MYSAEIKSTHLTFLHVISFFIILLTQLWLMSDVHIIVGLCVDQILHAVKYAFLQKKKTQVVLHVRFVWHISISGVSIGLYRFFQKPSQLNKIVLNQVEENAKTK